MIPQDDDYISMTERPRGKIPALLNIPTSEFLMGTGAEQVKHLQLNQSDWAYEWSDRDLFSNEQPQHKVKVNEFQIAQYPVTNAEYYEFVWDVGYPLPKGWFSFTFPADQDYHPVTGVSKKDAEAYVEWLKKRTGMKFRLPTEPEWELAARGTDGRIYPWGNTFDPWRCNTSESMKKTTTPAGFYSPGGDSIYGVADMVGNVWEWTCSVFRPYPYRGEVPPEKVTPNDRFVVRGGAWYYSRKLARCACREGMNAMQCSDSVGFRVACDKE